MDPETTRALFSAFIVVVTMLLVGFPIHEFMHAWTAFRLGDSTARWQGRVSLDPRVHFDPMGGVILAVTAVLSALGGGLLFGWAKPTPINPMNIAHGRRGEALVAFAGPASNLVIAVLVAIPLRIVLGDFGLWRTVIETPLLDLAFNVGILLLTLNVVLFLFNLVPIPPLDGWRALGGIVPAPVYYRMRGLEAQYANVLPMLFFGFIIILFLTGGAIISPIINGITRFLLGI